MPEQINTSTQASTESSNLLFWKIFIKTTLLSFVFVFIFLIITAIIGAFIFNHKISEFEKKTGTNREALIELFKTGWNQTPKQTDGIVTMLVLGVDTLANRGDVPALTDTMLLTSIHLKSGEIHLLPIPRDLWSEDYKTKVNSLYSYGDEQTPGHPEQFPTTVIQDMTGVTIDHTIVISLETLADLIDTVEGVEIDVPVAFTDTKFPRTDVDVTVEHDPAKLYKTISFQTGKQTMDGQTALEYIRSRHSEDEQGTDNARSSRQQLVIRALIEKLLARQTLRSTATLAQLYTLYSTHFNQYLPMTELISLGKVLYPYRSSLSFINESISLYPESETGVIFHPPERQYQNQWVYAVKDQEQFKKEIQIKLLQNETNQVEYNNINQ